MSEASAIHVPTSLDMMICDTIWVEPITGKISLLGCCQFHFAKQLAFPAPPMVVYICLTDGRGKTPLRLMVVDVDAAGTPIFEADGEVDFKDPTVIMQMEFPLRGFVFPSHGEYRIQLFAGNQFVCERLLGIIKHKPE